MEQNTHSHGRPNRDESQHRHFVAFPLFGLVLAVSMIFGAQSHQLEAQLTRQIDMEEGVLLTVAPGVDALQYSGAGFTEDSFLGSALVRSIGLHTFSVQGANLSVASGTFYLTAQADSFTVAALTAPVVIRVDTAFVVVPIGMQWQSAQGVDALPSSLPQRFVERQLGNLSLLPEVDTTASLPSEADVAWVYNLPFIDSILLPKYRSTAEESRLAAANLAVLHAVETGNVSALQTIANSEAINKDLASVLLELQPEQSVFTMILLEHMLTDEGTWLVYAFHPRWRNEAWAIGYQQLSTAAQTEAIATLPLSDTLPDSVASIAIKQWLQNVEQHSRSVADPVEFVEDLVQQVGEEAIRMNTMGYPERSRNWITALASLPDTLSIRLPEEVLGRISYLQHYNTVDVSTEIALEKEEVQQQQNLSEHVTEEVYTPDQVEQRTRQMLESIGAIFTVETTVEAVEPNVAQVQGVLFSMPSADYIFDFQYNVATQKIRNIVRNTQSYPYALEVSAFANWLQQ